jgi:hypothetical protein
MKLKHFSIGLVLCVLVFGSCTTRTDLSNDDEINLAIVQAEDKTQKVIDLIIESHLTGDNSGIHQFLAQEDLDGEVENIIKDHETTTAFGVSNPLNLFDWPDTSQFEDGDVLLFRGSGQTWQNQLIRIICTGFYHHAGVFDSGIADLLRDEDACIISATLDFGVNGLHFQTWEELTLTSSAIARLQYKRDSDDLLQSVANYRDYTINERTVYSFIHRNLNPVDRFDPAKWYSSKVPWRVYWDVGMDIENNAFYELWTDDGKWNYDGRWIEMRASIFYRIYYWILKFYLPYYLKPYAGYYSDLKLRRVLDELISSDELRASDYISSVQHWGEEEPDIFNRNEGIIAITSSSVGPNTNQDGYFSGTGLIEIKNGKLTAFDYDLKYTKDEGIVYYASSGHSNYTASGSESGFFDDILTNKHYMESISDTFPVEPPGITPSTKNLVEDIVYDWQKGIINTITGSDWGNGVKQLPEWKVEFIYDGSKRVTKILEGIWNGTIITRYYDVSLFSIHDTNGFPQEEKNYQSDIDNLTTNPSDETESVSINCGPADPDLLGAFGKYFFLFSNTTEYYVWYNVGGQGNPIFNPANGLSGKTGIEVNVLSGDSNSQVASKTATAINGVADFDARPFVNYVSVDTVIDGDVTDATDGNTGFTISIDRQGLSAATTDYVYTYGSRETPETITMNNQTRQEFIYDASDNIKQINYYNDVSKTDLIGTLTFTIPEGLSLTFNDISPIKNPVGSEIVNKILVF